MSAGNYGFHVTPPLESFFFFPMLLEKKSAPRKNMQDTQYSTLRYLVCVTATHL